MNPDKKSTPEKEDDSLNIVSLDDQIIKYDMRRMSKEIEMEFEAKTYSQDLVTQTDIGSFFNLKAKKEERLDERN
tara:strand:- start:277 stop:501 length:225 start_codon:yes stop_codon:yes gene_type:complete